MKKIIGIFVVLLLVMLLTAWISPAFFSAYNIENLMRRSALFGIMGIGAAFVIMTGGIDLSIGSLICLVGCLTPWLVTQGFPVPLVLLAMMVQQVQLVQQVLRENILLQ